MSSPAQGPYKSRLFNFLNRRSLQVKERFEQTGRQIKVAVEWGVQILAYPVYLMVQAGRLAGRQLERTVERANLPPSSQANTENRPIPSDRPIAQVLRSIVPATELESSDLAPKLTQRQTSIQEPAQNPADLVSRSLSQTVRGVASVLETRDLVLISPENQILDVLSQQQQKTLQKRISWEVANYWYESRLKQEAANPYPELVSSSKEDNQNVLPPMRLFWRAIRWVQTSPVAIAVNLFGESTLVRSRLSQKALTPSQASILPQTRKAASETTKVRDIREILQAAVDYFFGKQTTPTLPSQNDVRSPSLTQSDRAEVALPASNPQTSGKLAIDHSKERSGFLQKLRTGLNLSDRSNRSLDTSEPDPFQIQALIQAAIDYFFGPRPERRSISSNNNSQTLSDSQEASSLPQSTLEDPWLSWNDLYLESDRDPTPLPAADRMPVKAKRSPLRRRSQHPQETKPTKRDRKDLIAREVPDCKAIEVDPDWIETKATPAGYVKHPLVKLLEGLDRLILWLEERLASLWRWLRHFM
jgi:hypothetical protein